MDVECIMQAQRYSGWQLSERRLRLSIFHLSFNRLLTPKSKNDFIPHIKCEKVPSWHYASFETLLKITLVMLHEHFRVE